MININFKKLDPKAIIPTKAHPSDAGFDMTAISVNETEDYIEYDTGIAIELPENHVGLVFPRSSISKIDLSLANAVGIIDSGYRSSIKFRFKKILNPSKSSIEKTFLTISRWFRPNIEVLKDSYTKFNLTRYEVGDRIGQLIIIPYPEVQFTEVETLSDSDRGTDGFGSTGVTTPADISKPKKTRRSRKKKTA